MADTQVSERTEHRPQAGDQPSQGAALAATQPGSHKVIRRNGKVTPFDASKIELAVTKAFIDGLRDGTNKVDV